jgi:hypothetical protein
VLLGDDSKMCRALKEDFNATSTSHVYALAG